MVGFQTRTMRDVRRKWKKLGFPPMIKKVAEKVWIATKWVTCEGGVPLLSAFPHLRGAWWCRTAARSTNRNVGCTTVGLLFIVNIFGIQENLWIFEAST